MVSFASWMMFWYLGGDTKEHNERFTAALKRIETAGVTLNPSKCQFGKKQLKFLDHLIDHERIRADPDKTSAIIEMEPPTNISELRWFMGMVNQLGKFLRTWQTSLTPYDNSSARNQRGCGVLTKIEHSQISKRNWQNQLFLLSMIPRPQQRCVPTHHYMDWEPS